VATPADALAQRHGRTTVRALSGRQGGCYTGAMTMIRSALPTGLPAGDAPVEWLVSPVPVDYGTALRFMERRVEAILAGAAPEAVWLLEHPPIYTCGTSARDGELLDTARFPVYRTGRGGRITYHGPGQRVAYVMLDLKRRGADVRAFVCALESWLIATLAAFGISAHRSAGKVGVWVDTPLGGEAKIAALGVRVRRWISLHGVALNVDPDLSHFAGIVPCGLAGSAVTSMRAQGVAAGLADVDEGLRASFAACLAAPSPAAREAVADGGITSGSLE
jgi:lipoyl(octanoyl) transferase